MWNAHAPELWRRTTIAIRRHLARTAQARGVAKVKLSYAKVAEFQARGLIHFHAIFRLDGHRPATRRPAHPARPRRRRAARGRSSASGRARRGSPPSPTRPGPSGWDIRWGAQLDTRTVRMPPAGGQVTNVAVASYLAKYATKSTEAVGDRHLPDHR